MSAPQTAETNSEADLPVCSVTVNGQLAPTRKTFESYYEGVRATGNEPKQIQLLFNMTLAKRADTQSFQLHYDNDSYRNDILEQADCNVADTSYCLLNFTYDPRSFTDINIAQEIYTEHLLVYSEGLQVCILDILYSKVAVDPEITLSEWQAFGNHSFELPVQVQGYPEPTVSSSLECGGDVVQSIRTTEGFLVYLEEFRKVEQSCADTECKCRVTASNRLSTVNEEVSLPELPPLPLTSTHRPVTSRLTVTQAEVNTISPWKIGRFAIIPIIVVVSVMVVSVSVLGILWCKCRTRSSSERIPLAPLNSTTIIKNIINTGPSGEQVGDIEAADGANVIIKPKYKPQEPVTSDIESDHSSGFDEQGQPDSMPSSTSSQPSLDGYAAMPYIQPESAGVQPSANQIEPNIEHWPIAAETDNISSGSIPEPSPSSPITFPIDEEKPGDLDETRDNTSSDGT